MPFTLDAGKELSKISHQNSHWRKRSQMQRMRHGKRIFLLIKSYFQNSFVLLVFIAFYFERTFNTPHADTPSTPDSNL